MEDFQNDIAFLLYLKWQNLKREHLSTLTYQHVKKTIYGYTWADGIPQHLSDAAQDIANLSVEDIVKYLTIDKMKADDSITRLVSLLEGGNYEEE